MDHNLYNVLGISATAPAQEVKAAYKRLALKYHPDRNPGSAHAEELFKLVNTAYQTLSDPEKRARYDLRLQYQREQQRIIRQHQAAYYNPRYQQTRPPAPVSERHYRNIRHEERRFSRRDWYITLAFVAGLLLFSLLLKVVMDHITGEDNYKTALSYMEEGKYSSAHRLLSDAIRFKPGKAAAYEARAKIELDVFKDYAAALHDLNKAIALQEQPSARAYYMRGRSHLRLQQYRQAEQDLTRALQLNEKFWPAHLARGEVRLFYLKKYEPAIEDFTVSLHHSSGGGKAWAAALTYRGFGYYKTGAYALASEDYQKVLAADAKNGRVYYLLGRNEIAQQLPEAACAHFNKAYDLGYSAALLELRANCPGANP